LPAAIIAAPPVKVEPRRKRFAMIFRLLDKPAWMKPLSAEAFLPKERRARWLIKAAFARASQ
jgi:hypothetical protein